MVSGLFLSEEISTCIFHLKYCNWAWILSGALLGSLRSVWVHHGRCCVFQDCGLKRLFLVSRVYFWGMINKTAPVWPPWNGLVLCFLQLESSDWKSYSEKSQVLFEIAEGFAGVFILFWITRFLKPVWMHLVLAVFWFLCLIWYVQWMQVDSFF